MLSQRLFMGIKKNAVTKIDAVSANVLSAAQKNAITYIQKKAKVLKPEQINVKDHLGNTPLHYACMHCHVEMTRLLLKIGADPNAKNCDGNTPLHVAFKNDNPEVHSLS